MLAISGRRPTETRQLIEHWGKFQSSHAAALIVRIAETLTQRVRERRCAIEMQKN